MAMHRSSSTPPGLPGHRVPSDPNSPLLEAPPRAGQVEADVASRPPVEIRPSTRRKKSATAFYSGDGIVVLVPARLSLAERQRLADRLVERLLGREERAVNSDAGLEARAAELSDRYLGGVRASSVRWVGNQQRRWGSCTPATRQIRISSRLRSVPSWVLDAVLVHELAHLLEFNHSARFHELERRYPRRAESDAYLAGYSLGLACSPAPAPADAGAGSSAGGTILC